MKKKRKKARKNLQTPPSRQTDTRAKNVEALPLSPKEIERQAESAIKEELKKIWQTRLDKAEHARKSLKKPPARKSTFKAPRNDQSAIERMAGLPKKLIEKAKVFIHNRWPKFRSNESLQQFMDDVSADYNSALDREAACKALLHGRANCTPTLRPYIDDQLQISKLAVSKKLMVKTAMLSQAHQTIAVEQDKLLATSTAYGAGKKIADLEKSIVKREQKIIHSWPSFKLNPELYKKQESQIRFNESLARQSEAALAALPTVDVSDLSDVDLQRILPRVQAGVSKLKILKDQVTNMPGGEDKIRRQIEAWREREDMAISQANADLAQTARQRRENFELLLEHTLEAKPQITSSSLLIEEKWTALSKVEAAIMVRLGKWPAEEIANSEPTR